jgi:hypothetical protein
LIIGSATAIDIKNNERPAQICFHLQRPHTITEMYDYTNMDITVAESVNVCIFVDLGYFMDPLFIM